MDYMDYMDDMDYMDKHFIGIHEVPIIPYPLPSAYIQNTSLLGIKKPEMTYCINIVLKAATFLS